MMIVSLMIIVSLMMIVSLILRIEIDDLSILSWPSLNHTVTISSISEFDSVPSIATNIIFENGVGNNVSSSSPISLNFTRFIYLKEINIGSNALNGINRLIATNLTQLNSVTVGEGSLMNIEE